MTATQTLCAKYSLVFLWLMTGFTSLFFAPELSYEILREGGITATLADACLLAGALADIVIGLWLLSGRYQRGCYYSQIGIIVVFTLLISLLMPAYWLHPFGPVSKNVPILVLIWLYYSTAKP